MINNKPTLEDFQEGVKIVFPPSCLSEWGLEINEIALSLQKLHTWFDLTINALSLCLQEVPYYMVFGTDTESTGRLKRTMNPEEYEQKEYDLKLIQKMYRCEGIDSIEYINRPNWGRVIKFEYYSQPLFIRPFKGDWELKTYVWQEDYSTYSFHEPIRELYPYYIWNRETSLLEEAGDNTPKNLPGQ